MSSHGHVELQREQVELKSSSLWRKLPIIGVALAILGFAIAFSTAGAGRAELAKFWTSYVTAYMFAMSICLGGLFFVIVQHLTRASWSVVVRRLAENLMLALPFVALGGVPLILDGSHHDTDSHSAQHEEVGDASDNSKHRPGKLGESCSKQKPCVHVLQCNSSTERCEEKPVTAFPGSQHVFEWTHEEVVANDPVLSAKKAYLNSGSQKTRFVIYVGIWSFLSLAFWSWSVRQDTAGDPGTYAHRCRALAPIALLTFVFSSTFFAFDMLMSLDPHWFSTIFGVYYFVGAALAIHSLLVVLSLSLQGSGYLNGVVTKEHFHDLGKFMFGFTVFWAYIGFSQYFLIWYANIPEETNWFAYRGHGQWLSLSIALVFGRFVLPWFSLLRQPVKRAPSVLILIALFVLGMQYVDVFWLSQPAFAHHQAHYYEELGQTELAEWYSNNIEFGLADVFHTVGFIGVLAAVFGWGISRHPLVPVQDPRLAESLGHENF